MLIFLIINILYNEQPKEITKQIIIIIWDTSLINLRSVLPHF